MSVWKEPLVNRNRKAVPSPAAQIRRTVEMDEPRGYAGLQMNGEIRGGPHAVALARS